MDELIGITDITQTTRTRKDEPSLSLEDILFSGPFDIIDGFLRKLNGNELSIFYEALTKPVNQPALSQMMYFARYLNRYVPEIGRNIERIAIDNHRRHIETGSKIPYALSRFNSSERELIFSHLAYIQSTHGCSGDCFKGCGVDAVPGVRDRIPEEHIELILENISKHSGRIQAPKLFYASDPLELALTSNSFFNIAGSYHRLFNQPLEVVTSIPFGREELYKEICKNKDPSVFLCVSITEQNIKRLYESGILKHQRIDDLALFPGNNFKIPPNVFNEEYKPNRVNLVLDQFRENVGINRYNESQKGTFWNRVALLLTPYGIINTIGIPQVDKKYPQGRIVVSLNTLDGISEGIEHGEQVERFLTDSIVRFDGINQSLNRSFYSYDNPGFRRILINESGKVLLTDDKISDPGYSDTKDI